VSGYAGRGAPDRAPGDADWDEVVDAPPDVQFPAVRDAGRYAEREAGQDGVTEAG